MTNEPIEVIEIDVPQCTLTYGTGSCTAILGNTGTRKCYNFFPTCQAKTAFNSGATKTYRFIMPRSSYPKGSLYFPYLKTVTGKSATANIAGSDSRLESLGARGTIAATFTDAPYHDRGIDPYWSQRVSGAAQSDGLPRNPIDYGTFWTRWKARHYNYAGMSMRHIVGYVSGSVFTADTTRHMIISEFDGPDTDGSVTINGKDILSIADDDSAVAPVTSSGSLSADITASATSLTLTPSGIGDSEYPTIGRAAIGSELVSYTRSGDVITLTGRGLGGTTAATHSADDTFQATYSVSYRRIDYVIQDLLLLAGVPSSYIPFTDWMTECNRWAPSLMLSADIMKPTGVSTLIGELAVLGVTIWWDEIDQEIKLRINRPVDLDSITYLDDRNNIITAEQEDRQDDRLTTIIFNTVQENANDGTSDSNFSRALVTTDSDSQAIYSDTKIRTINCRWLNHGDDSTVAILSRRLLNRFKNAPIRYYIWADIKDDMKVVDVAEITSRMFTDDAGESVAALAQVIMREDVEAGHKVKLVLQRFQFDQRYGYITENTRPVYTSSTTAQKARGAYMCDNTLKFGDSGEAYRFI